MPKYIITNITDRCLFKIRSDEISLQSLIKFLDNNDDKTYSKYTKYRLRTGFIEVDYSSIQYLINNTSPDLPKDLISLQEKLYILHPKFSDEFKDQLDYEQKFRDNEEIKKIKSTHPDTRFFMKNGVYYCEIESEHYHCDNLDELIKLVSGEYFIISKKPGITVSDHDYFKYPLAIFQPFDTLYRTSQTYKSAFRFPKFERDETKKGLFQTDALFKYQRIPKKKAEPALEHHNIKAIIIDGADDAANALNNSGLPRQTAALLQGLLIFPMFIRGVLLGVQGLGGEFTEALEKYHNGKEILVIINKINSLKKKISEELGISITESDEAEDIYKFIKKIASHIKNLDNEKKAEFVELIGDYENELEKLKEENIEFQEVITNLSGYIAMNSMMSSVVAFQVQASANIFGGSKLLDETTIKTATEMLPILDFTGSLLGIVGQSLMTFFAINKAIDEGSNQKEVKEEIDELKKCNNIDELTKKIALKILSNKENFHASQLVGNSTLALGQMLMAAGSPLTTGLLLPLLVPGVALTFTGVGINSYSAFRYGSKFEIDEEIDEFEEEILTSKPTTPTTGESINFGELLKQDLQKKICALEILGHFRYARYHIHQKYLGLTKDEINKPSQLFKYIKSNVNIVPNLGLSKKLSTMFNEAIEDSLELYTKVRLDDEITNASNPDHQLINANLINSLKIDDDDIQEILRYGEELSKISPNDSKYQTTITKYIEDIFTRKLTTAHTKNTDAISVAKQILQKPSKAEHYLKMKLIRAKVNGEITLKGEEHKYQNNINILYKNNEQLEIETLKKDDKGQISLDEFDEISLSNFLNSNRTKKDPINYSLSSIKADGKKKTVIARALEVQKSEIRSQYLRPLSKASQLSTRKDTYEGELEETKSSSNKSSNKDSKNLMTPHKNLKLPKISKTLSTKTPKKDLTSNTSTIDEKVNPIFEQTSYNKQAKLDYRTDYEVFLDETNEKLKTKADEDGLLKSFNQLTKKVSIKKELRQKEIKSQNTIVEFVQEEKPKYQIISKNYDLKNNTTIYVYANPTIDLFHPDYDKYLITVKKHNDSQDMEIIARKEDNFVLTQKAFNQTNAFIIKFKQGSIKTYGKEINVSKTLAEPRIPDSKTIPKALVTTTTNILNL